MKRFLVHEMENEGNFTIPYAYLADRNLSDDFWTIGRERDEKKLSLDCYLEYSYLKMKENSQRTVHINIPVVPGVCVTLKIEGSQQMRFVPVTYHLLSQGGYHEEVL